uniref:Uncharacterized protein n=1 Tax=Pristionchus pacificus TaxID=54126 RepID=A0A2A6BHM2_PRIPA|eukprot:PDM65377.1 hypothetical protein PRIPAC_52319 [Pristionchus pacificus]
MSVIGLDVRVEWILAEVVRKPDGAPESFSVNLNLSLAQDEYEKQLTDTHSTSHLALNAHFGSTLTWKLRDLYREILTLHLTSSQSGAEKCGYGSESEEHRELKHKNYRILTEKKTISKEILNITTSAFLKSAQFVTMSWHGFDSNAHQPHDD